MAITQLQLETYKTFYPDNQRIQNLTLNEINENTSGTPVFWGLIHELRTEPLVENSSVEVTDCQMAFGTLIFDSICIALGAAASRGTAKPAVIKNIVKAAEPVIPQIELIVASISGPKVTPVNIASGIYLIIQSIYNGGILGAVMEAFLGGLTWWEGVLYGISGIATIVAVFATSGAAFVAQILLYVLAAVTIIKDIAEVTAACYLKPTVPLPAPLPKQGVDPYPFLPKFAIRTRNGHYITAIKNGGLGGQLTAIQTNKDSKSNPGNWDKFVLVRQDNQKHFALRTADGFYVTAVDGGGKGGPEDASCPIQTNRTKVGAWETFTLVDFEDGRVAIYTTSGHYFTATKGGGVGDRKNAMPIHTDARSIARDEVFQLEEIDPMNL